MRCDRVFAGALVLAGAACAGATHDEEISGRTCDSTGRTRAPQTSEGDLAHFVYRSGSFYYARVPQKGAEPALGERLGTVTCTVAGSDTLADATKPVEGAAGFVAAGTPIFALQACPSAVAIAARWEGRAVVFVRQDASADVSGAHPVTVHVPLSCKAAIRRVEP